MNWAAGLGRLPVFAMFLALDVVAMHARVPELARRQAGAGVCRIVQCQACDT